MSDLPDVTDAAIPGNMLSHCPIHQETPLHFQERLAANMGWKAVWVKDETGRMGLGSFKALGGAYAVFSLAKSCLERELGRPPSMEEVMAKPTHAALQAMTVCCASAGNHGLSVAAGAGLLGIPCEIFLADSVPESFAERLREKGAIVVRAGTVYEEAMACAAERGKNDDVILISDASWEGEMEVPSLVMQGYAVMADEICKAFERSGQWPSHVALQAGVGGIAAAVSAHIRQYWAKQPQIIIVEPDRAPCLQESVKAGRPVMVEGPVSNMGRLDCKEPSLRAFDILKEAADHFITISDEEAQAATEQLKQYGLVTSPSGAAGFAGLKQSELGPDATVLFIATEGDPG